VIIEGTLFGYDILEYNITLFVEIISPVTILDWLRRVRNPIRDSHCETETENWESL
jgi:hypothetical protein